MHCASCCCVPTANDSSSDRAWPDGTCAQAEVTKPEPVLAIGFNSEFAKLKNPSDEWPGMLLYHASTSSRISQTTFRFGW